MHGGVKGLALCIKLNLLKLTHTQCFLIIKYSTFGTLLVFNTPSVDEPRLYLQENKTAP